MRPDRRRVALVGLLALIYALCYSTIKAGLAYAPPLHFASLRALGGGAILLSYLTATGTGPLVPPRATWAGLAVLSTLGTVILYGAMFMSPGVTGAGVSSVLGNTGPLFTVALAAPILGEGVTRRKAVALVAGVGGATLVAYPTIAEPSAPGLLAAALPLTAAAAAAGSAVLLKWLDVGSALITVVAWQLLLGGTALSGLATVLEPSQSVRWAAPFVAYLLFLSVAGTAFAVSAWYWLVQREDVGRLSIGLMVLVPPLGLAAGWILFAETIGLPSVVGAGLAVLGVALALGEGADPGRVVEQVIHTQRLSTSPEPGRGASSAARTTPCPLHREPG